MILIFIEYMSLNDTKLNIKDEPNDGFYIVKKTKEELILRRNFTLVFHSV